MSNGQKSGSIVRRMTKFLKNSDGNVAIMLGLSIIPMFMALGAAVDTVRASREQTAFQSALDAATIAIAADDRSNIAGMSQSQKDGVIALLQPVAQKYVERDYVSGTGAANDIVVKLEINGSIIDTSASHTFPTAIMGLIGVDTLTLNAKSQTQRSNRGGVELALVMDTTGSMSGSADGTSGSGSKIDAAKAAAKSLLSIIHGGSLAAFPDNQNIRTSLVPFTTAVRLNKNAYDFNLGWIDTTGLNPLSQGSDIAYTYDKHGNVTGTTTTTYDKYAKWAGNWSGCVEARTVVTDLHVSDAAPSPIFPDTLFPAYYNNDSSNHSTNCDASQIVPMTYNRANIETGIDAMTANGSTLIPSGLAWGWRTLSQAEPFSKVEASPHNNASTISPYNDTHWKKVMVLMTDGDNSLGSSSHNGTSSTAYSSYGYSNEPNLTKNRWGAMTGSVSVAQTGLDVDVLKICNNIKAQGIELYVTGFGVGIQGTSLANLQACASSPASTHYTNATNNAALLAFFQQIGNDINNNALYVSK
jgi:Flp pilus assembly protein TadG